MSKRLDTWAKMFVKGCLKKRAYRTLGAAKEAAKKAHKDRGVELHCYLCPDCGMYHLTRSKINNWTRKVF